MERINDQQRQLRELTHYQESLLSNVIIEFGSNMLVLNHPDVRGLHVKGDPTTQDVVVELFVHRVSGSLRLLAQEEYGGHGISFFEPSVGARIRASLS